MTKRKGQENPQIVHLDGGAYIAGDVRADLVYWWLSLLKQTASLCKPDLTIHMIG